MQSQEQPEQRILMTRLQHGSGWFIADIQTLPCEDCPLVVAAVVCWLWFCYCCVCCGVVVVALQQLLQCVLSSGRGARALAQAVFVQKKLIR
jgi:hypothetical protein